MLLATSSPLLTKVTDKKNDQEVAASVETSLLERLQTGPWDGDPIAVVLSKLIGFAIIILSPVTVISQNIACYRSQGAKGISFQAQVQLVGAYVTTIGYN